MGQRNVKRALLTFTGHGGYILPDARALSGVTRRTSAGERRGVQTAGSLRIEPFEGSRPDLAGQLLNGYSIDKVIRNHAMLLPSRPKSRQQSSARSAKALAFAQLSA
jgi:hypothetical protein